MQAPNLQAPALNLFLKFRVAGTMISHLLLDFRVAGTKMALILFCIVIRNDSPE